MRTSTIYTIGTALTRAQGSDVTVDVLVTGQWLHGHVSAVDGHGLVLHGDDDVLSVLRMDSISAVQVRQAAEFEAHAQVEAPNEATVHPMPSSPSRPDWAHPDAARTAPAAPPTVDPAPWAPSHATPVAGPIVMGPVAVPSPRNRDRAQRPTVGPITAPSAVPDAGLHTMLRPRRQSAVAEQAPAS
ncbi:hypothetical protein [Nocardioides sp. Soil805]|uniref:hypothetical protein n=1 Tax=Nocardioides sp. Soil805 TaxID=1736416 RepID=UPI00070300DA|nr:hypothetical protein [Nocardioides sp. Soil805]KRF36718.1 hypothetical protein ASG94_04685 [Nocardioides sp. Soil805]